MWPSQAAQNNPVITDAGSIDVLHGDGGRPLWVGI